MKKTLRGDANTSALAADPKKNHPAADPFPGGAGRPKFNQPEMVTTYKTQFGEDRCTQFRVIVVTDPPTPTQLHTNRQGRLQYTAPQLARSIINSTDQASM